MAKDAPALPEPDRIETAPHPRETLRLFGHEAAEQAFLQAFGGGRLHHAWLITGAKGVGKASLAWRLARFLLAQPQDQGAMFAAPPPASLDVDPEHPVSRRILQMAEPRLFVLRRGANASETALSADIRVDEVRKMKSFFALSSADGGRRVAIIDCADELNTGAANALLKLLEEPPQDVTFFVIAHQPHKLLPTIRSRCRELRLAPPAPQDLARALEQAGGMVEPEDIVALGELAQGSVGEAFRLSNEDGLAFYQKMISLLSRLPRLDRPATLALAESASAKGAEGRFEMMLGLIDLFLARMARAGVMRQLPHEAAQGEGQLITRWVPDEEAALLWADLAQSLSLRARRGRAVNLDPAALLLDSFLKIEETAAKIANK